MAVAAVWVLVSGTYCLTNFWCCRETHCVVTGLGWTALGLLAPRRATSPTKSALRHVGSSRQWPGRSAAHVVEHADVCRVLIEARMLAAFQPQIAAAVEASEERSREQLRGLIEGGIAAGEWPGDTDPNLAAVLFTAGLYGLMAKWHLKPGSFSWEAATASLVGEAPSKQPHLRTCRCSPGRWSGGAWTPVRVCSGGYVVHRRPSRTEG